MSNSVKAPHRPGLEPDRSATGASEERAYTRGPDPCQHSLRSRDRFAKLSQVNAGLRHLFNEFARNDPAGGLEIGIETYGNNSVTADVHILFTLWHKDLI